MPAVPTPSRLFAILSGSAGNLVEWYDWYIYSAASLYFAPVFFPKGDPTTQLLQTAAVFAVGFFARPVGAWMLGICADRVGRKAALTHVGTLLVPKGFEVTETFLERAQNFGPEMLLEKVRVLIP